MPSARDLLFFSSQNCSLLNLVASVTKISSFLNQQNGKEKETLRQPLCPWPCLAPHVATATAGSTSSIRHRRPGYKCNKTLSYIRRRSARAVKQTQLNVATESSGESDDRL